MSRADRDELHSDSEDDEANEDDVDEVEPVDGDEEHPDDESGADTGEFDFAFRLRELNDLQRQLEGLEHFTHALQALSPGAHVEPAGGPPGRSREGRADEGDDDGEVHPHVTCDGCRQGPPLMGRVMHCADCEDFDLCARCYSNIDNLDHPRGHRFHPRRPQPAGHRGSSAMLLRMLENAMLGEALRRSVEGENSPEEQRARNEQRGREVLAKLPRQAWCANKLQDSDGSQSGECALCLEDYEHGEEVLKLPCAHYFHENCVRPWFAKSLLCPLCQREATPSEEGASAESSASL